MPQNSKNQRSATRKGKGKKRTGQRVLPLVTSVPAAKSILMTFSTNNSLVEAAAGTGASWFYRLNSVYDPDNTGVGATAAGYSTWAANFLNYKVRKVTVRVRAIVTGSAGGAGIVITAPVPGQAVIPSNPSLWRSIRGSAVKMLNISSDGGHNSWEMTRSYDLAQWLGVTRQQYDDDMDFSGAVGSNPSRQLYFMVGVVSNFGSTPARTVYSIDITYLCEWFNPTPMQL